MTDEYCKYEHDHPEQIPHEHGETIECLSCPAEWEVLVDDLSGEFELVRTEVTQPETWYTHPVTKGFVGIGVIMAAILGPVAGGLHFMQWYVPNAPSETELWAFGYLVGICAMGIAWLLATNLSHRTPVDHWVWLLDRWGDTRYRRKE